MMYDLELDDATVSGKLDENSWLDIMLNCPRDRGFCICKDESKMLIIHLATVFDIDLKRLEKD